MTATPELRIEVKTNTVREAMLVTARNTVWERTTETIRVNETGATLFRSVVTDCKRDCNRKRDAQLKEKSSVSSVDITSVEFIFFEKNR